ncbi:unnamed protein product [Rodentolepis nana]|uniref:ALMS_motif domain-containing protein n=1 Tax=Rodentolepis nana TaxID=102285 RepID=A0A0R3TI87_RODNA|nr:unnamed protein product [Rodentolepis nana]
MTEFLFFRPERCINPSCITFNLSESVHSEESPVSLAPPINALLSEAPTTLSRAAANSTIILGYPRIVIESEAHSLSPPAEMTNELEHSSHSNDRIAIARERVNPSLSTQQEKEERISKLRQMHLRALEFRRSFRPVRKLKRQVRCSTEQNQRRFSSPSASQRLKTIVPEVRSLSTTAAPNPAVLVQVLSTGEKDNNCQ